MEDTHLVDMDRDRSMSNSMSGTLIQARNEIFDLRNMKS